MSSFVSRNGPSVIGHSLGAEAGECTERRNRGIAFSSVSLMTLRRTAGADFDKGAGGPSARHHNCPGVDVMSSRDGGVEPPAPSGRGLVPSFMRDTPVF